MKIIRYERSGNQAYGVLEEDSVRAVRGDIRGAFEVGDEVGKLDQVRLLAPVQPGLVVCVAGNCVMSPSEIAQHGHDHQEFKEPVIILKAPSSVVGHLDNIVIPTFVKELSVGAEVAVVIGREAREVPEDRALEYVLGYTCALDVAAWGLSGDPFAARAKSQRTFCPLGPAIATDLDSSALRVICSHNGAVVRDKMTTGWVFGVARVISSITGFMTLRPLDVVLMGSLGELFGIAEGDIVEMEIEEIGTLRAQVVRN